MIEALKKYLLLLPLLAVLASCGSEQPAGPKEDMVSGTIDISVDDTYRPVIEAQLHVFDSSFPEAHIRAHYKPESECFKDLLSNKARLILVSRPLNASEKREAEAQKLYIQNMDLARDAVAVIMHPSSPDTNIGISELKGILTGVYKNKYTVVFDNQGSSTVRYITDSLIPGEKLGSNVYATKNNDSVISYVATHPGAIGFIGLSYVSDRSDERTQGFLSQVKVAALLNDSARIFYKPYQAYIALRLYPFTRHLMFVSRESSPMLGTGLINFLAKDRGQLIFSHYKLFPLRLNVIIREADINNQH